MGRKINIGCGENLLHGFENIDTFAVNKSAVVIISGALDYDYRGAEIVYAGHFIEHLKIEDCRAFMRKVIKESPEAQFIVTIPAIDRAGNVPFWWLQSVVFGGRRYPGDDHKTVWRVKDLENELRDAGYKGLKEWADCPYLQDRVDWQVCIKATLA